VARLGALVGGSGEWEERDGRRAAGQLSSRPWSPRSLPQSRASRATRIGSRASSQPACPASNRPDASPASSLLSPTSTAPHRTRPLALDRAATSETASTPQHASNIARRTQRPGCRLEVRPSLSNSIPTRSPALSRTAVRARPPWDHAADSHTSSRARSGNGFPRLSGGGMKTWLRRLRSFPQLVRLASPLPHAQLGQKSEMGAWRMESGERGLHWPTETDPASPHPPSSLRRQDFELAIWQMCYLCIAPRRV